MFQIGAKVKLVHHDQYPRLVGLKGTVTQKGERTDGSPPRMDSAPSRNAAELVYQVRAEDRTLYDVPESWLKGR